MMLQNVAKPPPLVVPIKEQNVNEQPFGTYPPTRIQQWIRKVFFGTPFGYMSLRRPFIERFKRDCKGPVDSYLFGFKVRFYPKDNQTDAKSAVCGTCYNAKEWRWVAKYLPVGGVFVDIGANMGFFSLFSATRKARLVAIEPQPALFKRLSANLAFNNIEAYLVEAAVGEKEENGTLVQTNLDYGSGRMGQGEGETVSIRPLLDILADAGVKHIDMLKIDIEGYEDRALLPFLDKAHESLLPGYIIMEYSERDCWHSDLMGRLKQAGYSKKARSRGNILLSRK
ncbi:MAG: FkbM family methyltransferase [Acetobacter syzygii]|uniref:Methyltransferase FkbM domain-containing protein n=2 Tax=Acetobacter syzygii TaxID=146476 RepID=A0A270BQS3_9PROT|nr:hypothetical protein B9K05_05295 [Acetobacter syzygii]PAL27635.1 hypothetical protein B9K04_02230 [Acetobacter syzygii]